ncbi:MAG: hypothetical protein KBC66_08570 [Kiritimatiellae bacterium]|jgi:hypothetical protein|nr:hypothetical protein [Kiritimatiellia bacterium]NLD88757.1 hypothetical protein [Lentisphaerota bacterium]HOU20914.1 hypothetical protein [Kiritimatiellia bacterium]HPC18992.1 hypothetical protein [Kiritimatiellia bacterium]HQN80111.1 hypothetical protein [Kiritimatiellia bacterium]
MKCTTLMIVAALAAGAVFAQEDVSESYPLPPARPGMCGMTSPHGGAKQATRGDRDRSGGPMSPEMKEQMRAEHRAIRQLGAAARAETDETKKAELVEQLRAKLGEAADRMQAHQEERLAQAEERLAGLKERVADGQANRDARIEEQIQRILSGERPPVPDAFRQFPYAKSGRRGYGPGPAGGPAPPPDEASDEPAPPPPGEMPDDLPPSAVE